MVEVNAQTVIILLGACLALLVLGLLLAVRIFSRLNRLERLMRQSDNLVEILPGAPSTAETSKDGAFEMFLSENPERRNMAKGEKFAAYRQWRKEKGMNWSNS